MKRLLTMVLALSLLFTLAIPTMAEGEKKVCFVTSQRLGDNGPVDLIYEGILGAQEICGFDVHVVEAQPGEYEESMQAMIVEGYNMIVAAFPELIDAINTVSAANPDVDFMHTIAKNIGDNVHGYGVQEQQSSYIVGAFMAMATKTKKIAFVGGVDNVDQNNYVDGLKEGVASVDSSVEVEIAWAGSFEDPAKVKELSLMMYNNGCDIVWSSSGKGDAGLMEACKEMGEGYYCIGQTRDHNAELPGQMLGCHIEDYIACVTNELVAWYNDDGYERSGLTVLDAENGYCYLQLAPEEITHIDEEIRTKIADIGAKVASGEIVVQSHPSYEDTLATVMSDR